MRFDPKIDSVEDVLAIRKQAIDAQKSGGTIVAWSVNGTSVTKLRGLSIEDVLDETAAFLKMVCPDIYGRRVKRTIPVYL